VEKLFFLVRFPRPVIILLNIFLPKKPYIEPKRYYYYRLFNYYKKNYKKIIIEIYEQDYRKTLKNFKNRLLSFFYNLPSFIDKYIESHNKKMKPFYYWLNFFIVKAYNKFIVIFNNIYYEWYFISKKFFYYFISYIFSYKISIHNYINCVISFLKKNGIVFSMLLSILLIFFFYNITYLNTPISKQLNKYLIVLVLIYTLFTNFLFLKKLYSGGKYTSVIQRFWKRSFILFWLIELFLFIFFIYLLLTHFTESSYFLDLRQLNICNFYLTNNWLYQLILVSIIIYFNYLSIIFFKNNNLMLVNVFFILINLIMLVFFYNEFYKFFYTVNYYYNNIKSLNVIQKKYIYLGYYGSDFVFKTRNLYHYISLITFLKFWHFVFIYFFYIFVSGSLENNKISYDLLSSNLSNFIFYMFFNTIIYVFIFKNLIIFYFTEIYYWFFIGSNYKGFYFILIEIRNILVFSIFI